jgi:hypothetical protein
MTDHVIGICFTENLNAMLSNNDIHCFQFPSHQISKSEWGSDLPRAYRSNLALGKLVSYSSDTVGGESSNAVDGKVETPFVSTLETDPWVEVKLGRVFLIRQVVVYKNLDTAFGGFSTFILTILDDDRAIRFQEQYTSNDDVVTINIPAVHLSFGSGVKISLKGDNEFIVLNIGEIEVFGVQDGQDGPVREVDIPSGRFFSGRDVNYVTFIQEHGEAGISRISDLRFVNGFSAVEDE